MIKVFFCDLSRITRHPAAITEADLGECYNRMAHPTTSIVMQSWGVPNSTVNVVLTALQLIQFCLRIRFGESPEFLAAQTAIPLQDQVRVMDGAPLVSVH